jgi:hypothetical protein
MSTNPSSTNAGTTNASGPIVSDLSHAASTERSVDTTIVGVADEIWSELVAASLVENPSSISSYYNDMIKNDDKSDFKLPSELTINEYVSSQADMEFKCEV